MEGPMQQTKRALVVDDDLDVVVAVTAVLEAAGYAVLSASSAREAIALLPSLGPVDLAVLDLMMEESDSGVQVAQALRRRPETAQLPIVLLTAVAEKTGFRVAVETGEEREWLGVDAWLDKPVSPERLLQVVERMRHG
jgi:CheY-like chemotaxis protein